MRKWVELNEREEKLQERGGASGERDVYGDLHMKVCLSYGGTSSHLRQAGKLSQSCTCCLKAGC